MNRREAVRWIGERFRFPHPDWTVTAEVGPVEDTVVVTVTLRARDSSHPQEHTDLRRWRWFQAGTMRGERDLLRWLTVFILSVQVHETLEWVEVGDGRVFHPHTAAGQAAWAEVGQGVLADVRP